MGNPRREPFVEIAPRNTLFFFCFVISTVLENEYVSVQLLLGRIVRKTFVVIFCEVSHNSFVRVDVKSIPVLFTQSVSLRTRRVAPVQIPRTPVSKTCRTNIQRFVGAV